jgi:SAM-dependent methyltransferase
MRNVPCNLCGSERYKVLYRPTRQGVTPSGIFSASGGVRGTQTIVRCLECGLVYVNPRVDDATLMSEYSGAADDYPSGGAGREKTFRLGLGLLESRARDRGRLLDVGCADGIFVKLAKEAGWDARGVEPCRYLAERGRREFSIDVRIGDLAGVRETECSFDAITLWDVLEHFPDPMAGLHICNRLLKKGGYILISYPDFGSLLARAAGRYWWFLLSVHLYYFTRETLAAYCARAGFRDPEFSMHWQALPLEHLLNISRIYVGRFGELLARGASRVGIGRVLVPYYAAQTDMIARKE